MRWQICFFGDFVALVVEALLHLPEEAACVDELHLAATLRRFAVRHEPDVGEDAGVVEELIGQRHDGVQPVVFDDPAANVGPSRSRFARKEWGAVEDDGDFGAGLVLVPLLVGMHLGNHMLQKEKRSVIDGREPCAEPARKAHGLVLPVGQHPSGPSIRHRKVDWPSGSGSCLRFEAVPGLAVAESVAEDDVGGVFVLDQHVRATDGPGLVVVFLAKKLKMCLWVLVENQPRGFGEHSACSARWIVDPTENAWLIDILLPGIDQVRHETDDFAWREVVPRLFVGLFVETHHQMLEQIAHLEVVDPVRVKIDFGHRLDDGEKAVTGVELFDLISKLETLENVPRSLRKAVDVRHEVRRDVLCIPEQPGEGVRARVV